MQNRYHSCRVSLWGLGAAALLLATSAIAQQPSAGYVYPAGGQQGATVDIAFGGQFLDGASELLVSGGGVKAEIGRHIKLFTRNQVTAIRNNIERMEQLDELGKTDPERATEAEGVRKRVMEALYTIGIDELDKKKLAQYAQMVNDPKRQLNPAISETVFCKLTIAPNASLGDREIRFRTSRGLTNPIRFKIGKLPEIKETEPNDRMPETALDVAHPFVVNGQIFPSDVDRFRFSAKKGENIVAVVEARALIPYLADAVPGWFQSTLALHDAKGNELAFVDDFRFDPDPVLTYVIPEDGDYVLTINDSIYRGREDFVYRITVGELPFLSGVYPLGGRARVETTVSVFGSNLSKDSLTFIPGGPVPNVKPIAIEEKGRMSNWVLFSTDDLQEAPEMEPNDEARIAQRVDLPVVINGRIDRAGDRDVFRFNGRQGQRMVAEIIARRLGSPLDSVLRLFDAQGQMLTMNDDFVDKGAGLVTHHADSRIEYTLPADGTYYLQLIDAQNTGSDTHAYRCVIGGPRPGYDLRVVPASINARAGDPVLVTVFALRRDGFNGDIDLLLKEGPKGIHLSGARVPAGQDKVRFTMVAPSDAEAKSYRLRFEGVAKIGGQEVRREAITADDMMQAFFYRHLVVYDATLLTIMARPGRGPEPNVVSAPNPLKIPAGGKAAIHVEVPGRSAKGTLLADFELSEPAEGLSAGEVSHEGHNYVYEILAAETMKPGTAGNLIIEVHGARFVQAGEKPVRQGILGVLPAIPFEVVKP